MAKIYADIRYTAAFVRVYIPAALAVTVDAVYSGRSEWKHDRERRDMHRIA